MHSPETGKKKSLLFTSFRKKYNAFLLTMPLCIASINTSGQTTLLSEDFNTLTADAPPPGWTAPADASGHQWHFMDATANYIGPFNLFYADTTITPGKYIGSGELFVTDTLVAGNYHFAYTESFLYGGGTGSLVWTMTLESPGFDATGYPGVQLDFDAVFRHYDPNGNSNVTGMVEVFNGASWIPVYSRSNQSDCYFAGSAPAGAYLDGAVDAYNEPLPLSKHLTIDITSALAGYNNARLRFSMTGNRIKVWAIDNIVVTGFPVPLSIKLHNLSGRMLPDNQASLTWSSSGEPDQEGFLVQYAADGKNFENLGFVTALRGKGPGAQQDYSYTDTRKKGTKGFYRLQIRYRDGSTAYSNTLVLQPAQEPDRTFLVFPNPATEKIYIQAADGTVHIYDISGQLKKIISMNGAGTGIDVSDLAPGLYFARYNNGRETLLSTFVKK